MTAPAFALEDVVVRYGDHAALDGVSLRLQRGAMLALLGPNGAGKTTLVGAVSGLLRPASGTVDVPGTVGLAPQEIGVYPGLTVRQNLVAFAELAGRPRRDARRRALALSGPLLLGDLLDRRAGTLSGGEQRRLHTAIALAGEPSVALLDEPTAGADATTRTAVLELVRGLAGAGTAVLYTTHYLPEVEALGADVALLQAGRIVVRDSQAALIARFARPALVLSLRAGARAPAGAEPLPDGRLRVACDDPGPALAGIVAAVGDGLDGVEIVRPTLEAAYLALTGRTA